MSDNEYDSDPESIATRKMHAKAAQPTGGASTSLADTVEPAGKSSKAANDSLPPAARPRESLDGETMFAVGDDGMEWSDGSDDDDDDEGRKLTKKISPP